MELATIDILFIVLYFFILIIIGFIVSRKETNEDFLISSRKVSLFSAISTINASKTGAVLVAYSSLVFLYGISAMWYFIGTIIGYLVFIPFAVRLFKQSDKKQYTLAEYFYKNYGSLPGKLSNVLSIILMIGFLIINLTAAASVFGYFTGMSFTMSTVIILIAIMIYVMLGGFKAVVKTDIIQYVSIIGIMIIIPIALFSSGFTTSNVSFNLFEAGGKNLFGFLLLGLLSPFASPELWQRIYSVPDVKTLKKSILFSSLIYLVFGVLLTTLALIIKNNFPNIDPNIGFVSGLSSMLPAGLIGLTVILLISAFMSSIDTYIFTAASGYVQNFMVSRNKTNVKNKIRIVSFIVGLLGFLVTISISDLVDSVYLTAFLVVLAIPTIVTWLNPKVNKKIIESGFLIGLFGITIQLFFEFSKEVIDPTFVLKGIGLSILGLIIGWIYSKIKK